MQWVTREYPHTDRVACPSLIRKFIEPDAEIVYVPSGEVLPYAASSGAISFCATSRQTPAVCPSWRAPSKRRHWATSWCKPGPAG